MLNARLAETVWRETHHALRGLAASPAFSLTAVAVLAIGIGGITAIFTLVRAALLEPLPYPAASELVYIDQRFSLRRFEETRETVRTLSRAGAYLSWREDMVLSGGGAPEGLHGARVSANFLDVLGTRPLFGRGFLDEDDQPTGRAVALISSGLWKRRFGADPQLAGKTIVLDAVRHTVVGVLPDGFAFPFPETDVWVPRPADTSTLDKRYRRIVTTLTLFGRLAPGVSIEQAQSEIDVVDERYRAEYPKRLDAKSEFTFPVRPLKQRLVGSTKLLWTLLGAVALVLLIACVNIAGLTLTRASSRSHEYSVRSALGATSGRLAGSLLAESALVTLAGSVAGVALAQVAGAILPRLMGLPANLTGTEIDAIVLGFTAAVSVAVAIPLGLFPAFRASRRARPGALTGHGAVAVKTQPSLTNRILGIRGQDLLVVAQVAISVALLVGAITLLLSFTQLFSVDTSDSSPATC